MRGEREGVTIPSGSSIANSTASRAAERVRADPE